MNCLKLDLVLGRRLCGQSAARQRWKDGRHSVQNPVLGYSKCPPSERNRNVTKGMKEKTKVTDSNDHYEQNKKKTRLRERKTE